MGAGLRLIDAALQGHAGDIFIISQQYPGLTRLSKYYNKALYFATTQGHLDCIIAIKKCFPHANPNYLYDLPSEYASSTQTTSLHEAAARGHDACITALREHFPSMHHGHQDTHEMTPLMLAARHGHPACIRALGRFSELDPDEQGFDDFTALSLAANYRHPNCIIALQKAFPLLDPNIGDSGNYTPLMWASVTPRNAHSIAAIRRYFPKARVSIKSSRSQTAMEMAALHGNPENIAALFKYYPKIDPLYSILIAEEHGHINAMCELYRCFPRLCLANGLAWFYAAMIGDIPKLKSVFRSSAKFDINMKTPSGITALMCAAAMGSTDSIRALTNMSSKTDVNLITVPNYNLSRLWTFSNSHLCNSALSYAALYGHADCISTLFYCFPNLNHNLAPVAILMAAVSRHPDCIREIHRHCPNLDVNAIRNDFHLPLLHCVSDPQSIATLYECFPSIACNAIKDHQTPLIRAVHPSASKNDLGYDSSDWIRALAKLPGTDPHAKNESGQNALFVAVSLFNVPAIVALGECFPNMNPNIFDKDFQMNCLMLAVSTYESDSREFVSSEDRHNCIPALCTAFSTKINVNMQDSKGRTALMFAAENPNPFTAIQVRQLFDYFPTINLSIRCKRGKTALMYAVANSESPTILCTLLSLISNYGQPYY